MGPELLAVLQALKDQQAAERVLIEEYAGHLVFCQPNGKPLHGHNVTQRTFRNVLDLRELRKDAAKRGVREEDLPKKVRRVKFHTPAAPEQFGDARGGGPPPHSPGTPGARGRQD